MSTRSERESGERLLLVSVSTAGASGSLRVQVWRKLRSLGALYLQQSVCLLPDRPEVSRQVRRLLARVRAEGGTGRVVTVAVPDPDEYAGLVGEFNAERDGEYAEVCERTPSFLDEIAAEKARGRATYAEVEESEADLERFTRWLAKIERRDYFGAPGRSAARHAVADCERALADFETEALRVEAGVDSAASGPEPGAVSGGESAPRLRVAGGD